MDDNSYVLRAIYQVTSEQYNKLKKGEAVGSHTYDPQAIYLEEDNTPPPTLEVIDETDDNTHPFINRLHVEDHKIEILRESFEDVDLHQVYKYKGSIKWTTLLKLPEAHIGHTYKIEGFGPEGIEVENALWICYEPFESPIDPEEYADYWCLIGGVVDLSNYVTLNTEQTITGPKTFTAPIYLGTENFSLQKRVDGNVIDVYVAGLVNPTLTIGGTSSAFKSHVRPADNKTYDLGRAEYAWKDLWLDGFLQDNSNNKIAIKDIADKTMFEDYLPLTGGEISGDLTVDGNLTVTGDTTLALEEGTAGEKFVVSGTDGVLEWRSAEDVLTDIGALGSIEIDDVGVNEQALSPIIKALGVTNNNTIAVTRATLEDLGLARIFNLKGSVATRAALFEIAVADCEVGDVWHVVADNANYVWVGNRVTGWKPEDGLEGSGWHMLGNSIFIPIVGEGDVTININKNHANNNAKQSISFNVNTVDDVSLDLNMPFYVTDLDDEENYLNVKDIEQTKAGKLNIRKQLSVGQELTPIANTPLKGYDLSLLKTTGSISGLSANSGKRNILYGAYKNPEWIMGSNYQPGSKNATVKEGMDGVNFYSMEHATDGLLGTAVQYYSENLETTPLYIIIENTASHLASSATYLNFLGWRHEGDADSYPNNTWLGMLKEYKVELYGSKNSWQQDQQEWITVFERNNEDGDVISNNVIPLYYGGEIVYFTKIRITVSKAVNGSSNSFGFAEIKLLDHYPHGKAAEGIGALDIMNPIALGKMTIKSKSHADGIVPFQNDTMQIGEEGKQFNKIYGKEIYENGARVAVKEYVDDNFVTLDTEQTITGLKHFNDRPLIKVIGTKLPEAYQEVEYIASTGTQYIDTGIVTNNNSKIVIQAQATDAIGMGYRLFGSRTGAKVGNFISTNNDKVYVDYGGSSFEATFALDNNIHTYNLDKNKFYYDGVLLKEWNIITFNAPSNAYLFGAYHDGSIVVKPWKVWYCRLYDNGRIVRDLVPCYRKSDNIVGMYDLVSGNFFTNKGTGVFSTGRVILAEESGEDQTAVISDIPTKVSQLENDSGFVTEDWIGEQDFGVTVKAGDVLLYENNELSTKYSNTAATTVAVGGLPRGSSINGWSLKQIIDKLFYQYQAPSLGGISYSESTNNNYIGGTLTVSSASITVSAGSTTPSIKNSSLDWNGGTYSGNNAGAALTAFDNKTITFTIDKTWKSSATSTSYSRPGGSATVNLTGGKENGTDWSGTKNGSSSTVYFDTSDYYWGGTDITDGAVHPTANNSSSTQRSKLGTGLGTSLTANLEDKVFTLALPKAWGETLKVYDGAQNPVTGVFINAGETTIKNKNGYDEPYIIWKGAAATGTIKYYFQIS